MICTTTPTIEGRQIQKHFGIVGAEVIFGANLLRDVLANITDLVGGRSENYEKVFSDARGRAVEQLQAAATRKGANAIVGVRFEYLTVGSSQSMLMVAATGTAVLTEKSEEEKQADRRRADEDALRFFLMLHGSSKGPFGVSEIRELFTNGKVLTSAMLKLEGTNEVRTVGEVLGTW